MNSHKIYKITSLLSIPLLIWLLFSLTLMADFHYRTLVSWIGQAHVYILLNLTIVTVIIHSYIGFEEIFTDYIHGQKTLSTAHKLLTCVLITTLIVGLYSLNQIYFLQ